ncbi:hypothetical protein [Hydrogenophaga sp.]|uniref:hypothetical protein n=1 Tax=Hydrogenophaga sp. TaxID=1904254 RepID=UPI0027191DC1|nr:hypothetical protein [Hydrogenophaga sp.]MDO9507242.1 hypothetical protein [Hydrogenophaga sp.]
MAEAQFTTGCGREVFLERLDIRTSTLGILEGSAETIRAEVLQRIPDEVSSGYGQTGLLLHEPPPGPLPAFTYFMQLHSYVPLKPDADCSSMVAVWFDDALPADLPGELAAQVRRITWEEHAVDGVY